MVTPSAFAGFMGPGVAGTDTFFSAFQESPNWGENGTCVSVILCDEGDWRLIAVLLRGKSGRFSMVNSVMRRKLPGLGYLTRNQERHEMGD